MFKELYRKLTIMNALILIAFLLIFSYSIVGFSNAAFNSSAKNTLVERKDHIVSMIYKYNTLEINLPDENIWPEGSNQSDYSRIDYVIWDEDLKLAGLSVLRDSLMEQTYVHAQQVMKTQKDSFTSITISGVKYRLYTGYVEIPGGRSAIVQVYQSRLIDDLVTRQIFLVVMSIGVFSVIVLIFISAHMAKKSLEPVRRAYERQKEFIADASHELRTPLTIIKTTTELLGIKEQETIKENAKWLENISSETENMSKLIQNLLTLAQADNNQIPVTMDKVDLSKLVRVTSDKFQLIAKEKDIEFESIISENVHLIGDKDKLNQLLVILLDNGIKYTPERGKITISLMHTTDKAIITVKDTGMGISQEDINKIFERFYRVDKARSREQGGAGLGLSIANWIVREHKGKISVESEPDKGSSFIVELPKKRKQ
jgi:signal transduction histidine kinase